MTQKTAIHDLAIFGGAPAFEAGLHVGRPNVGDRERLHERIDGLLDRRWLTNNGPLVQEFEAEVSRLLGVRHCVAMCNGTVALEILIRALGLKGDVIVPAFTFVATAHALQWLGIRPVFCDVDPRTHNIDPDRLEALITPETTGVIGVHLWGRPCDAERLGAIARRRNLALVFDAAHAFGCSRDGTMVGNFGDAEVLSFHATKFFNTFEGGAVTTNDDALARRLRLMRNFGFEGYDNVVDVGTNGKMTEVCAAMGLTGLESLDEFVAVNKRNYDWYSAELSGHAGIALVEYDAREQCNYQYVVAEIDESTAGIDRDALVEILHAENVLARRYFHPGCQRMEPYLSRGGHAPDPLPVTERLSRRLVSFPTGTAVDEETIKAICSLVRFVVQNGSEINRALASRGAAARCSGVAAAEAEPR